jgi:hypothetical protein
VAVERRHGDGEVLAAKIFDARARERGESSRVRRGGAGCSRGAASLL